MRRMSFWLDVFVFVFRKRCQLDNEQYRTACSWKFAHVSHVTHAFQWSRLPDCIDRLSVNMTAVILAENCYLDILPTPLQENFKENWVLYCTFWEWQSGAEPPVAFRAMPLVSKSVVKPLGAERICVKCHFNTPSEQYRFKSTLSTEQL